MKNVLRIVVFGWMVVFAGVCYGQRFDSPVPPPSGERPELPEYLPEEPGKGLKTPVFPERLNARPGGSSFELRGVAFEGNTVFSDEELQKTAEEFLNLQVTLADLEELRYRLTRVYTDAGYINSGALLKPGQSVDDGLVVFLIQEGRLDQVSVTGNGRLRPGYIQGRLWPDSEHPFNIRDLQERFQMLLEDPLIERMDGQIRPGVRPGEAALDLHVTRATPFETRISFDNHRPPSTGAESATMAGTFWNLTGFGDSLDASFQASEGAQETGFGYTFPLTSSDTRLSLAYNHSENSIVEDPLKKIDIKSRSESLDVIVTHPFIRTLRNTLDFGLTLSRKESKTMLAGETFSFTSGDDDGKARATVVRFFQSFQDRTPSTAFAVRSTFSLGVDLFGCTVHDDGSPDGEFFAWVGQVQYAQRIGNRFGQIIFRADAQAAEDSLLSLEQFSAGGANTVRGYRENELVRDNGYVLSVEWRYPLFQRQTAGGGTENILQIAPFVDYGMAQNRSESGDELFSAGVGLLFNPSERFSAEVYAAHDIEEVEEKDDPDLQDDGIHFRVSITF